MKFIKPTPITATEFVSSTRAENDYAAWSNVTTYAQNAYAISTTTHRIYKSAQAGNLNHDPTTDDGTWWVDVGPTNRWAMFDDVVGTVTSQATPLTVVLDPGIIDALALLDVAGTTIHVTMTDGAAGPTVYDKTYTMGDTAPVEDWYDYFFEPIVAKTVLVVTDLPPYASGRLTVTINAATTAECGTLVVGRLVTLGTTLANPSTGIVDYSRKDTDAFGATSVLERGFAKKIDARFTLDTTRVDYAARQLSAIRATPVVWVLDDQIESLVAFGFFRDFGIDIPYPSFSQASITIEGLI